MSLEECQVSGGLWRRLTARHPDCGNARALAGVQAIVTNQLRSGPADPVLSQILFLLERKDAALALARRHIRMKTQLEIWLYLHIPFTIALLVALLAHVLSVFIYW
jgi:hypothetical protein